MFDILHFWIAELKTRYYHLCYYKVMHRFSEIFCSLWSSQSRYLFALREVIFLALKFKSDSEEKIRLPQIIGTSFFRSGKYLNFRIFFHLFHFLRLLHENIRQHETHLVEIIIRLEFITIEIKGYEILWLQCFMKEAISSVFLILLKRIIIYR